MTAKSNSLLENKVKKCYESAPFPNTLSKAKNFNKALDHIVYWTRLNLEFLFKGQEFIPPTILCAGCGTGEEVISLAKIWPNSKIDAIDISNPSLEIAKQNIKRARVNNITLKRSSIIDDLPSLNKKYDLVYSSGVVHHLSDPKLGFKILADKVKNDGRLVIMLYNSYGLFAYRFQLLLLKLLAGVNHSRRLVLVNFLGLGKGKDKAYIYDSFINPQVTTYSIEQVIGWGVDENLKLIGLVPPLGITEMVNFAIKGQDYFFRRKGLLSFILKILKIFFRSNGKIYDQKQQVNYPLWKTLFYQIIFLVLGRGESVYLFKVVNRQDQELQS